MITIHLSQSLFFFFNDTATTEIYTLSLHDALPISSAGCGQRRPAERSAASASARTCASRFGRSLTPTGGALTFSTTPSRSEEHTSELQSRQYLVCRLLLEKKKKIKIELVYESQSTY